MAQAIKRAAKPAAAIATKKPAVAAKPAANAKAAPTAGQIESLVLLALEDGGLDAAALSAKIKLEPGTVKPVVMEMIMNDEPQIQMNGKLFELIPAKEEEPEPEEETTEDHAGEDLFMVCVFDDEENDYSIVAADLDEALMTKEYNKLAKKGEDAVLRSAVITGMNDEGEFEIEDETTQLLPEIEQPEDDPEADEVEGLEGEDDDLVDEYNALAGKAKLSKAEKVRFEELEPEIERRGLFGPSDDDEEQPEEPDFSEPVAAPKGKPADKAAPIDKYVPMARLSVKDLTARIDESTEAISFLQENGMNLAAEMLVRATAKAKAELADKQ